MRELQEEDERDTCFSTLNFPFLPLPPPTMLSPDHPSGMATPPLHTLASVPFKWEELPGKPRPCTDIVVRPEFPKCLDLPPCRMERITKMSSPTTVLDGPYIVGRPKFSSFRLFREARGSFDSSSSYCGSPQSSVDTLLGKKKTTTFFGRSFKLRSGSKREVDGVSFGFSPLSAVGYDSVEKCPSVKKLRRRNGSYSSLPRPPSTHLWVTVRESLKKVIPWKSSRKSKNEEAWFKECDI